MTTEPFADVVARIKADRGRRAIVPGIERGEIAMWNVVPWFLDPRRHPGAPTTSEIEVGCTYLPPLLDRMPNLRVVVLLGGTARRAHIFLSRTTAARIVSCHHTSAVVMGPAPWKAEENVGVFRFVSGTG